MLIWAYNFYEVIFLDYKQSNEEKNTTLAKLPKAKDGKLYILVLQVVMCALILSVVLVFRTFFNDLFIKTRTFYKDNFEDQTTTKQVLETSSNNKKEITTSTINLGEGGPYSSSIADFNEIRSNIVAPKFLVPLKNYVVTSSFGQRQDPFNGEEASHNGLDLAAKSGEEIVASLAGVVEKASKDDSYGNYVIIKHSKSIKTLYAHCSKLLVKNGEKVVAGQTIATVGSTGRSTGPHLHFEVILNNKKVNPQNYITLK